MPPHNVAFLPCDLDPPAYAMTVSRYVRETIAIAVYPEMRAGRIGLTCADDQARAALDALLERVRNSTPSSLAPNAQAYARAKVDALFANSFDDDVWYSQAAGLPPVLFVKKTAIDGVMSLEDAVRFTHQALVADALRDGHTIPPSVYAEYRAMFESKHFEREMQP